MSDSLGPHRCQPTRLPRPWDSPGKNTGAGFHFLLQCMKVKSESEVAQSCLTLGDPMDFSLPGSSIHGVFQARILEWGAVAFSVIVVTIPLFLHTPLNFPYGKTHYLFKRSVHIFFSNFGDLYFLFLYVWHWLNLPAQ